MNDALKLACKHCGWRPPEAEPMSLAAAHFDVEHNTTHIEFEMVVVCDRCDQVMTHLATIGEDHHYECKPCHRGRIIRQRQAVVKVARAHARVADTRRDWQHKLSTAIIRENQAVYVEDLCVAGLGRTRLAKSVHDAGWASFVGMLGYKAARWGRTFGKIDRFTPSTGVCPDTGARVRLDLSGCRSRRSPGHSAASGSTGNGRRPRPTRSASIPHGLNGGEPDAQPARATRLQVRACPHPGAG